MLADATLLNLATTKVVLALAMACSVGCFAVVLMRLLAVPFRRLKTGPRHMCAALAAMMLVCLVRAQKSGDGGDDGDLSGGTNDVVQVSGTNDTDGASLDGMGPLMMGSMAPDVSPVIDATDIARDCAALTADLPRMTANGQITQDPLAGWIGGENIWSIPFGWNVSGTTGTTAPYKAFAAGETQVFTIDVTGKAGVIKLQNSASREIGGHVYFNGAMVW